MCKAKVPRPPPNCLFHIFCNSRVSRRPERKKERNGLNKLKTVSMIQRGLAATVYISVCNLDLLLKIF